MGCVYKRGERYYVRFKDLEGRWIARAAADTAAEARKVLREVEKSIAAGIVTPAVTGASEPPSPPAPRVLADYVDPWIERRRRRGLRNWQNERSHLVMYVLPQLGQLVPTEIRVRHIADFIDHLRSTTSLAPRTILKIYGTLHCFFKSLLVSEVIPSSPCVLTKEHLPKNRDKDREWRANALFSRDEVEVLLSSKAVPADRQMFYAIVFLTGMRLGEAVGLRWRDLDPRAKPLMRLAVARSYDNDTKTERPRMVPIHPVLAEMLIEWRRTGFPALMGRAPKPDDLIVPSREEVMRTRSHGRNKLLDDMERLSLRHRRLHDSRRTFITLARVDGARKDVLEQITHATRGNIMDLYTTLPWPTLCEAVQCLKISRLSGEALEARELELANLQAASAQVLLETSATKASAEDPITDEDWCFLASEQPEATSAWLDGAAATVLNGGTTGSNSTESDSSHGREYPESGKSRKRSHVTDFVTEKKNRVASVQKAWKSHAILKVEAPGVEPGSEVTRREVSTCVAD